MIKIYNLRTHKPKHPWDFKVDRTTILGNHYNMKDESERAQVCEAYNDWFYYAAQSRLLYVFKNIIRYL